MSTSRSPKSPPGKRTVSARALCSFRSSVIRRDPEVAQRILSFFLARSPPISLTTGKMRAKPAAAEASLLRTALIVLFAATVGVVRTETGAIDLLTTSVWLLLALSSVALLAFIVFRAHVSSIARRLPFKRLSATVERFADGLAITGSWRNLGLTTVYSLLLWLGIALQFWLMLVGLNLEFTFREATLVLVAAALGSIAQVPGIGGGFQAAFIFCVTTFFLVPLETAVGASLVVWFLTYVPTIVVAAIYMTWKGISARDLITPEPA